MKIIKIFKMIFSRLFLIALSVIVQVFIITYFMFKLTTSYIYFQIGESILGVLIFVALVNKKMNPEQKMVWAFILLVFPIFGTCLYLLLNLNKPRKKRIERLTKFNESILNKNEEVYNIAKKYEGQIKYIEQTSYLNAYKNTKTIYYKDGNEFYNALLDDLKKANKFIFMEYFIIRPGKMWNSILDVLIEKASQGVDVRVIYDDVGSSQYVKGNYYKKLEQKGIKCRKFNTMIPLVSSYHNNRDHRKITIIDGYIGYTGGINLGDEYINLTSPFGYWKDNAVKLIGEAVDNLTILFLQSFALMNNKPIDFRPFLYKNNKEIEIVNNEIIFPYGTGPDLQYYDNMSEDIFLNMFNQAKVSIDITTPYLIISYTLINALISAVKRGIKVRILIPSIPDKKMIYLFSMDTAYHLAKEGIEIYTYTPGFNHAKSILIDDEIAFVGTTNLDFRSLLHHYECGVWLYNSECIKDIDANFESDYLKSKLMSLKDLKMNPIKSLMVSFLKIFQSLL